MVKQLLLDKPLNTLIKWDLEKTLYLILIILALATRLWGLGDRVQSHDESLHTKYSWDLYAGHGFRHTPLMHGPFLFHATALSYFLFGDNDFTARLTVALMGVALVAFPYLLRSWLGRAGALATAFFLLISPSIAYYSRYIRHDIPLILWSLIVVFAIFSYLRDGHKRWLYLLAAGVSLMFATKEVAFIYNAIFGLFLVGLFVIQALRQEWSIEILKTLFLVALAVMMLGLLVLGTGLYLAQEEQPAPEMIDPSEKVLPGPTSLVVVAGVILTGLALVVAATCLLIGHLSFKSLEFPSPVIMLLVAVIVMGIIFRLGLPILLSFSSCGQQPAQEPGLWVCTRQALQEFEWPEGRLRLVLTWLPFASGILVGLAWLATKAFRSYRTFDLIVLLGTLCLPFLAPFLIVLANLDPVDYNSPTLYYSGAIVIEVFFLAGAIGLTWDLRQTENKKAFNWLIAAAIHYAIFIVLFTTIFTNGAGIASGMVGSLGYWLAQQAVKRGGQPWYYYGIMAPLYEYLPLLLTLVTCAFLAIRSIIRKSAPAHDLPFISFLLWWIALAWLLYSYAGEKMPWLTVHLALPMIILSGWSVGRLLERTDWQQVRQRRAWLLALAAPPFVMALGALVHAVLSGAFQGYELAQLDITGQLLSGVGGTLVFGVVVVYLVRRSERSVSLHVLLLVALLLPVLLTIRTAWRFCYINYDYPTEHLVYAHAGPAVKETMRQIEELSRRVAGGPKLIEVAYGPDGSWPFHWYLRDYPNAAFYGEQPSREQMEAPIVIAGREQWEAVAPYMGDDYLVNTYTFLWWPMEDYKNLTWTRVTHAITDTQTRAALWDIWYNRDYRRYEELTGKKHTLDEWPLHSDYRLYIRRDVAAQMWSLSAAGPVEIGPTDPYAKGWQELAARQVFGSQGEAPGQFQSPRGIQVGPDGFIYVADSGNQRIQKFTTEGEFVAAWGERSTVEMEAGAARGFNEPWDVAVAPHSGRDAGPYGTMPAGAVYVADTWNHRIQKLDAEGNLIAAWGLFGEYGVGDTVGQSAFYGPRGVAIGLDGRVYVADTGNKRIQVFEPDGQFAFQWGGGGVLEGYLDEPVGIAIGPDGNVYVADTWNRRVQIFDRDGAFLRQWPISGWDSGLPEEKPYLAVDSERRVYVTDPGHYRVLVFDGQGRYLLSFGQYGFDERSFALPTGIAVAADGSIYVTDAHGGRVLVFDPLDFERDVE